MEVRNQSLGLLALGANLPTLAGMPSDTLQLVLTRISGIESVKLQTVSRFFRTPAYPKDSGPDFLNCTASVVTTLSAQRLLDLLHQIEADLGRVRIEGGRWQARGVDIDLIAFGDEVWPDATVQDEWRALAPERQRVEAPEQLILPHPRLQDRAFVLVPLAEIAPNWRHPRLGLTVAQMKAALPPEAFEGMAPWEP